METWESISHEAVDDLTYTRDTPSSVGNTVQWHCAFKSNMFSCFDLKLPHACAVVSVEFDQMMEPYDECQTQGSVYTHDDHNNNDTINDPVNAEPITIKIDH